MNEANKDEALRSLRIAEVARDAGNMEKARKFAEKAQQLYPCAKVEVFMRSLGTGASASAAPQGIPNLRSRSGASQNKATASPTTSGNPGTPAQRQLVSRIKSKAGDYYQVLDVQRDADDDGIKKAYRKLALKLHPDKCKADGAEDAFKTVSVAFSCLSDPDKRAFYDRTGHEDMASASAARASRGPRGQYAQEIDPEELFNAMFGNMFGMGPMGMGGRTGHRQANPFQQQQQQQRQGTQQRAQPNVHSNSGFINLVPFLILLLIAFMSNTSSPPPISLAQTREYQEPMHTANKNVLFYVRNTQAFEDRYQFGGTDRRRLESQVESEYMKDLMAKCKMESTRQEQMRRWSNRRGRQAAAEMSKPNCEKLTAHLAAAQPGY